LWPAYRISLQSRVGTGQCRRGLSTLFTCRGDSQGIGFASGLVGRFGSTTPGQIGSRDTKDLDKKGPRGAV